MTVLQTIKTMAAGIGTIMAGPSLQGGGSPWLRGKAWWASVESSSRVCRPSPSPSGGPQHFSLSQRPLGLFPRPYVMLQRNRSDLILSCGQVPLKHVHSKFCDNSMINLPFLPLYQVVSDGLWAL